jgi:hypothetical protein
LFLEIFNKDCEGRLARECCTVTGGTEGSFNRIVFCHIEHDDMKGDYVIKIPFIGIKGHWREGDAHMWKHESIIVHHIKESTKVPVPSIHAVDWTLENSLGAPYMIMDRLPGRPAYEVWFDTDNVNEVTPDEGDDPTYEAKQKRFTFLQSLAETMAGLQGIECPQTGMPQWQTPPSGEPPTMAEHYDWQQLKDLNAEDLETDKVLIRYDTCATPQRYFSRNFHTRFPKTPDPSKCLNPGDKEALIGLRIVLEKILRQPAFKLSKRDLSDKKEQSSFVLGHADLDLQNILVDDDGNVTGILDWDNCKAVPRSIGYASLPLFLRKDWLPHFTGTDFPYMSWTLDDYRDFYADAMLKTGCSDAQFTRKSDMYHAIAAALYEEGDVWDVVDKLFRKIRKLVNVDPISLLRQLGDDYGGNNLAFFLHVELHELLAPEGFKTMSKENLDILQLLPYAGLADLEEE